MRDGNMIWLRRKGKMKSEGVGVIWLDKMAVALASQVLC